MAIRIRSIEGQLVALCAAETISAKDDVYLDDGEHYALMLKFARDYPSVRIYDQDDIALAASQKDSAACAEKKTWLLSLASEVQLCA